MNKYEHTHAFIFPRDLYEEYVDLLKDLSKVMDKNTPRPVKRAVGDSLRRILKESGSIKEDCILTFAENVDGELVVILFENLTDLSIEGRITIDTEKGIATFIERKKKTVSESEGECEEE